MTSPETVLRDNDTTSGTDLYLSFELGDKRWTLTLSDGCRGLSRYTVSAGAQAEVVACIDKVRRRCGLAASAPVHSCYEAGRDGWWLHRWLRAQGIDNIVVDSASIEVNRRARRAKTDRLDGDKLLAMLLRHHAGGGVTRMRLLDDIHHLAILTADIDRLLAFYERILDAGVSLDLEEDGLRHAFITVGPHTVLHAFQVPGLVPPTDQPIFRRGRLDHFALRAASEEAFLELRRRLVAEGAAAGAVTDMGSLLNFAFVDPDGGRNEVVFVKPGVPVERGLRRAEWTVAEIE